MNAGVHPNYIPDLATVAGANFFRQHARGFTGARVREAANPPKGTGEVKP